MNLELPNDFDIEQHFINSGVPYNKVVPGKGGIMITRDDGSVTPMTQHELSDFIDPRLNTLREYEAKQTAKVTDLQGAMLVIKDVGSPVDQLMYSKLCTACAGANTDIEMEANMRIAELMDTYIMDLANHLLAQHYGRINMDILIYVHTAQYAQD